MQTITLRQDACSSSWDDDDDDNADDGDDIIDGANMFQCIGALAQGEAGRAVAPPPKFGRKIFFKSNQIKSNQIY